MSEISKQIQETVEQLERQRWLPVASFIGAIAVSISGITAIEISNSEHIDRHVVVTEETTPAIVQLASDPHKVASLVPTSRTLPKTPHHASPKTEAKTKSQRPHPVETPRLHRPELKLKRLTYSESKHHLTDWVETSPSLLQLSQKFPSAFPDAAGELKAIHDLDHQSTVDAEDLKNFHINKNYIHAFEDMPSYHNSINPKIFVWHWTVESYPQGVQQFIHSLHQGGKRVEFFIDKSGTTYQLFDNDHHFPAHAKGMNLFSQGVEIEAGNIYGYTPQQIKAAKMLTATFLKRNHLQPGLNTLMAHSTGDLLFSNPFYNNDTGQFHQAQGRSVSLDKFDPPKELVVAALDDVIKLT